MTLRWALHCQFRPNSGLLGTNMTNPTAISFGSPLASHFNKGCNALQEADLGNLVWSYHHDNIITGIQFHPVATNLVLIWDNGGNVHLVDIDRDIDDQCDHQRWPVRFLQGCKNCLESLNTSPSTQSPQGVTPDNTLSDANSGEVGLCHAKMLSLLVCLPILINVWLLIIPANGIAFLLGPFVKYHYQLHRLDNCWLLHSHHIQ